MSADHAHSSPLSMNGVALNNAWLTDEAAVKYFHLLERTLTPEQFKDVSSFILYWWEGRCVESYTHVALSDSRLPLPRLDLVHVLKGLLPVFTSHGHDRTVVRDVFRNLNDVIHLRSVDREEEVITSIEGDQDDYMATVSPSTSHIICRMMKPMPIGMIKSGSAYRTYNEQSETWWISDDIRHQILKGRGTAFQELSSTSPELKWIVQLLQIVGAVSLFATKILIYSHRR
jgi:hypothetical protein